MLVADLTNENLLELLKKGELVIPTGRFTSKIKSNLPSLANELSELYSNAVIQSDSVPDFSVNLSVSTGLRRWIRPNVTFSLRGEVPFAPLPKVQATPLLEWGLNWCVSNHFHECLIIHAAVVEKNGKTVVMPGLPGAGKSTLCAALAYSNEFRLLSDELTILGLKNPVIYPNPRPVSLKNKSIDIIREKHPDIYSTPTVYDTVKGSVSLFRPPKSSVVNIETPVEPGIVLFPKFDSSVNGEVVEYMPKGRAFLELANQSFNYPVLGKQGFQAIANFLEKADCYTLSYNGNLDKAVAVVSELIFDE